MNIEPVAVFHGPMTSKFGIPRQSGLAEGLQGRIVFEPAFRHAEAVRGLQDFDYLWLIWGFSANPSSLHLPPSTLHPPLTVRPPRLGGNERVGVFASRSPFRPNGLGLSCVYINKVELTASLGPVIHVSGADLMDGTPIYDVKPYVTYADSRPTARSGFVDDREWAPLQVELPSELACCFSQQEQDALRQVLALDPRPRYHDDPDRVYGMPFAGHNVRFSVDKNVLKVVKIV